MTATRARGARPRGAARRAALLEAALRIVADIGPDAVTHRRVAAVAELPLASTTYWFDSKDDLLEAALELAAERDIAALNEQASRPGIERASGAAAVEAALGLLCEPPEEGLRSCRGSLIAAYALWLEAARRPRLRALSRRWTDAYREQVGALLARGGSRNPDGDAQLLVAAADGLIMDALATGAGADLRAQLRRLAASLPAP